MGFILFGGAIFLFKGGLEPPPQACSWLHPWLGVGLDPTAKCNDCFVKYFFRHEEPEDALQIQPPQLHVQKDKHRRKHRNKKTSRQTDRRPLGGHKDNRRKEEHL